MSLKLMYITNKIDIALIAESMGVNRIFVDMEYIGKSKRQGGMDSVQNHHTIEDVKKIRSVITKADLLVRVNPIHDKSSDFCSSEEEIEQVIAAGADIVMLPYFKTVEEVKRFINIVDGRAKTLLLLETKEASEIIYDIVNLDGIDEIHIGINDLSLGYGMPFMFQLLSDGLIEKLSLVIKQAGIPFGFGGIASIGSGKLPAEMILKEHYRLGSSMVILSRSFCNADNYSDVEIVREKFEMGVNSIRAFEKEIESHLMYFDNNKKAIKKIVTDIVNQIN